MCMCMCVRGDPVCGLCKRSPTQVRWVGSVLGAEGQVEVSNRCIECSNFMMHALPGLDWATGLSLAAASPQFSTAFKVLAMVAQEVSPKARSPIERVCIARREVTVQGLAAKLQTAVPDKGSVAKMIVMNPVAYMLGGCIYIYRE